VLDGGVVLSSRGEVGGSVRLLLGAGFLYGYARAVNIDDPRRSADRKTFAELGLLMKIPVKIERDGRRWKLRPFLVP
jgi:hypothetical protein